MKQSEQETIRRILSNVLSSLEGGASGGSDVRQIAPAAEPTPGASPVIFIVLNGPDYDRSGDRANAHQARNESGEKGALHPGLERFATVEGETGDLAPKQCFMEPDRACVKSGACEMRGY